MTVFTHRVAVGAGVLAITAMAVTLAGCGPSGPTVATIRVAGDQTYKVELATPELIQHAQDLMNGTTEEGRIPVGLIVRDSPSVNAPWSWHIDPSSLEFADAATEVCDGLPEYVEDGTLTSDYYCPWSTEIIAIDGPGS